MVNDMWHNRFGPNPPAPFPAREGGISSPLRFGEESGERSENRSIRKFCKMYLTTTFIAKIEFKGKRDEDYVVLRNSIVLPSRRLRTFTFEANIIQGDLTGTFPRKASKISLLGSTFYVSHKVLSCSLKLRFNNFERTSIA